jgi:hypothetical protein
LLLLQLLAQAWVLLYVAPQAWLQLWAALLQEVWLFCHQLDGSKHHL